MKAFFLLVIIASVLSACNGGHVTGLPKHDSNKVQNYGSAGAADTSKKGSSFGTSATSTQGSDTTTVKK